MLFGNMFQVLGLLFFFTIATSISAKQKDTSWLQPDLGDKGLNLDGKGNIVYLIPISVRLESWI